MARVACCGVLKGRLRSCLAGLLDVFALMRLPASLKPHTHNAHFGDLTRDFGKKSCMKCSFRDLTRDCLCKALV